MKNILSIVVVVFSILATASVLLQQKGTGLSGAFGGGNISYLKRRGAEKFLVTLTIVSLVVVCAAAVYNVLI